MTYKFLDNFLGYPPIETIVPVPPASTPYLLPMTPGEFATAEDKVWGGGEFIFARASASIRAWGICKLTPVWDATNLTYTWNAAEMDVAANTGRELCVSPGTAMTVGQYGWFCIKGLTPINGSVSVAAATTFGLTNAGQVGANSAGRQVLNAQMVTAGTQTVVKQGYGDSGDIRINVPNTDGIILGGFLSGTGVGASSVVTFVDPLGKYILTSVANTANIVGTNVTTTYNNGTIFYNVAQINRPVAQGAIT
jgi:hypothetical protein